MKRVLIVDDAAFMRTSIKMMLKNEEFEVVGEAEDGLEAINLYKALHPDIVTMDITMPEVDGIEATKQIISFDPTAKIIMVSAMGQEPMIRDAVMNGATSFVVKPFQRDKLIEVLKAIST